MSYPGGQDPNWQGQPGPGEYPPNPQDPYGQNPYPYGQNPYGQPQYPQNPYGQPQQYAQPPYGQQPQYMRQAVAAPPRPAEQNSYAGAAIGWGAIALVITIVAGFFGYYVVGVLGFYAIYVGIRGIIEGARLSTHPGLLLSAIGFFLSLLSLALTAAIIFL